MDYRIQESLLKGSRIHYACPGCGTDLESKLEEAGTKDTCPICGRGFVVPGEDELNRRQEKEKQKAAEKIRFQEQKQHQREQKATQRDAPPAPAVPTQVAAPVAAQPARPPTPKGDIVVPCGTCNRGTLHRRKKYRMSGPVVVIGHILLIPSVLGILASAFTCVMAPTSAAAAHQAIADATRQKLIAAQIPQSLVDKVMNSEVLSAAERSSLTPQQRRQLDDAQVSLAAGSAGSALGGAFLGGSAVCFGVSCFVGGLLGWLLIMKKKVLQCDQCGAIVAAS